jgi:adenine-specific DNA-methyltransferase
VPDPAQIKELYSQKIFTNPKPINLIKDFLEITTNDNDIILDFFAGSGTTAHAVMELNKEDGGNRKYICVQLPEQCVEDSEAYKAGYKTIADICKERIRRASKKLEAEMAEENQKKANTPELLNTNHAKQSNGQNTIDCGYKVFKLQDSNFKQWRDTVTPEQLKEQLQLFIDPLEPHATIDNIVYELLLKNGVDINSRVIKQNGYFSIKDNENKIIFMLEEVGVDIIDDIIHEKPLKVIALDRIFNKDDQFKKNTALQMKDAEIDFKTI